MYLGGKSRAYRVSQKSCSLLCTKKNPPNVWLRLVGKNVERESWASSKITLILITVLMHHFSSSLLLFAIHKPYVRRDLSPGLWRPGEWSSPFPSCCRRTRSDRRQRRQPRTWAYCAGLGVEKGKRERARGARTSEERRVQTHGKSLFPPFSGLRTPGSTPQLRKLSKFFVKFLFLANKVEKWLEMLFRLSKFILFIHKFLKFCPFFIHFSLLSRQDRFPESQKCTLQNARNQTWHRFPSAQPRSRKEWSVLSARTEWDKNNSSVNSGVSSHKLRSWEVPRTESAVSLKSWHRWMHWEPLSAPEAAYIKVKLKIIWPKLKSKVEFRSRTISN